MLSLENVNTAAYIHKVSTLPSLSLLTFTLCCCFSHSHLPALSLLLFSVIAFSAHPDGHLTFGSTETVNAEGLDTSEVSEMHLLHWIQDPIPPETWWGQTPACSWKHMGKFKREDPAGDGEAQWLWNSLYDEIYCNTHCHSHYFHRHDNLHHCGRQNSNSFLMFHFHSSSFDVFVASTFWH